MILEFLVLLAIAGHLFLGSLTFALPVLWLGGRLIGVKKARELVNSSPHQVVYIEDTGWLQRVWISDKFQIDGILAGVRSGKIVWMPFANFSSVKSTFPSAESLNRFNGRSLD